MIEEGPDTTQRRERRESEERKRRDQKKRRNETSASKPAKRKGNETHTSIGINFSITNSTRVFMRSCGTVDKDLTNLSMIIIFFRQELEEERENREEKRREKQ
jgi:hypothetical protein